MSFKEEIIEFLHASANYHQLSIQVIDETEDSALIILGDKERRMAFHNVPEILATAFTPAAGSRFENEDVIHIWEDLWIFQQEKVRSKLLSLFGLTQRIHGRETEIIKLNNDQLINFLACNHMNVPIKAKYKYGLTYAGALMAVVAFSKSRPIKRGDMEYNSHELLRFCNKLNITVVGGFTKLINHFVNLHDPDDIMTYVDADWSDGSFYKANGFEFVEKTAPMKFWLNMQSGEREYLHIVLKRHFPSIDQALSAVEEREFLKSNGYKVVFNSGSYKFVLLRK